MITNDLIHAPANKELAILDINAGDSSKKRLISMGIHSGDKLIKLSDVSWGPVLIQNITQHSTKIALGKRLAAKIKVEYEDS